MMLTISKWLATWFGIGFLRPAPGTWGTIGSLPLVFLFAKMGYLFYMIATLILLFIGIWASEYYEQSINKHDSKEIVIDEVVGFLIAMTWIPLTWQSLLAGFVIFRTLDVTKPFPIRWLDSSVKGGMGVMMDDVAAGLVTNIILQAMLTYTTWFGTQIIHVHTGL